MAAKHSKPRRTSKPSPSADWWKLLQEWVGKRFGQRGITILALLALAGFIWWRWDKIMNLPGIAQIVGLVTRESLPRADPGRFSIAVAHLQGDDNSELEQILVDALNRFVDADRGSGGPSLQIAAFT